VEGGIQLSHCGIGFRCGGVFTLSFPNETSPAASFAAINCDRVIIEFLETINLSDYVLAFYQSNKHRSYFQPIYSYRVKGLMINKNNRTQLKRLFPDIN